MVHTFILFLLHQPLEACHQVWLLPPQFKNQSSRPTHLRSDKPVCGKTEPGSSDTYYNILLTTPKFEAYQSRLENWWVCASYYCICHMYWEQLNGLKYWYHFFQCWDTLLSWKNHDAKNATPSHSWGIGATWGITAAVVTVTILYIQLSSRTRTTSLRLIPPIPVSSSMLGPWGCLDKS